MLSPVVTGTLFGTRALAGLLAGALVSGVQMAVSMSNTGGAWDNAKKYIEVRRGVVSTELTRAVRCSYSLFGRAVVKHTLSRLSLTRVVWCCWWWWCGAGWCL